jgi:hypothetical protein
LTAKTGQAQKLPGSRGSAMKKDTPTRRAMLADTAERAGVSQSLASPARRGEAQGAETRQGNASGYLGAVDGQINAPFQALPGSANRGTRRAGHRRPLMAQVGVGGGMLQEASDRSVRLGRESCPSPETAEARTVHTTDRSRMRMQKRPEADTCEPNHDQQGRTGCDRRRQG